MLHNAKVTAFTVSGLLRENQQGEGGSTNPDYRVKALFFISQKVARYSSCLNRGNLILSSLNTEVVVS